MQSVSPLSEQSPTTTEVRRTLGRICDSATFIGAPQLRAFLTFVVEKTLAGDARHIKAYTVGVEALGRRSDFDPATDSIVRVEAGRLRTGLQRYYDADNDPVVISLPLGCYVPEFAWRGQPPGDAGLGDAGDVFTERGIHKAAFRSNLQEMRRSVAALRAEFAISQATMVQSRMIIARSRGTAPQPAPSDDIAA